VAPRTTTASNAALEAGADNKDEDEKNKNKSSSKGGKRTSGIKPAENHNRADAPRERQEYAGRHFLLVRDAYEKATGNAWNDSDSATYKENCLEEVPAEKIISTVDAVVRRTPAKVKGISFLSTSRGVSGRSWGSWA
jgi:hypothetical protein